LYYFLFDTFYHRIYSWLFQKQIEALKQLCLKAGIRDADIAACSATREFLIEIVKRFFVSSLLTIWALFGKKRMWYKFSFTDWFTIAVAY